MKEKAKEDDCIPRDLFNEFERGEAELTSVQRTHSRACIVCKEFLKAAAASKTERYKASKPPSKLFIALKYVFFPITLIAMFIIWLFKPEDAPQ